MCLGTRKKLTFQHVFSKNKGEAREAFNKILYFCTTTFCNLLNDWNLEVPLIIPYIFEWLLYFKSSWKQIILFFSSILSTVHALSWWCNNDKDSLMVIKLWLLRPCRLWSAVLRVFLSDISCKGINSITIEMMTVPRRWAGRGPSGWMCPG